jgi:DNA polymerase I-like protein with 3'-5' exonuclease and polymerase domains
MFMISIDTETTGLWFKHGCETFAVGMYDGSEFKSADVPINPLTRTRKTPFRQGVIQLLRKRITDADLVCMHNSNFDLKALCNIGVINEQEPSTPDFWERIVDTTILSHLHHNTDDRSLKDLSKQYLGVDYASEKKLDSLISKCRSFVRSRAPEWWIADKVRRHPSLIPASKSSRWGKMDMWLPEAVRSSFSVKELEAYFCYDKKIRNDFNIDTLRTAIIDYLREDCVYTYELAQGMFASLVEQHGADVEQLIEINNQVRHVVWKMETTGLTLHNSEWSDAVDVCRANISHLSKLCTDSSGLTEFTPNNLKWLLYDQWGIPCPKQTKTGGDSTDADTLIKLKQECDDNDFEPGSVFLRYLLAQKKYVKKLEFLESYRRASVSGKIYPSMNIVGTKTTRFSSSDPNEQNISKVQNPFEDSFEDVSVLLEDSPHLRGVFGPANGYWWLSNDYNQLQLRIAAVVMQDEEMIDKLNNGYDAHDITARRIFELSDKAATSKAQRRIAKNVNFGVLFGESPKNIEKKTGMPGLWNRVIEMMPKVHNYIEQIKQEIKDNPCVYTLGGYPLDVPLKINKWKGTMEKAAHAAVCYIIQGSEGVIVKRAMCLCDDYLTQYYPEGRIAMQVHDEINFEMPARFPRKHAVRLKELMEQAALEYNVSAPVNTELVTHSWSKGKELVL